MKTEDCVDQGKEILKTEFGFCPERSVMECHAQYRWEELIKGKSGDITGVYLPRTLTAHVSLDPEPTLLARQIHEYLGHGSYCEHTLSGRKIVKFEEDLSSLEEKIIGKKLPYHLRIAIRLAENTSLTDSDDPNFDLMLDVKDSPELREYIALKDQFAEFSKRNLLTYEGFAVWLEEFLLKKMQREDMLAARASEIKGTDYETFLREFNTFESENGLLSLIYRVGFPRLFDPASIKRVACEHIDLTNISTLILYGSKRDYGDIDLVAISDGKTGDRVYTQELDLLHFTEEEFAEKIKFFDIEATEPLLTGEAVIGSIERFRQQLNSGEFTKEAKAYLRRKALEAYNYAEHYYDLGVHETRSRILANLIDNSLADNILSEDFDFESSHFLYALNNISYVLSLTLSSELYASGRKPMTLKDVIRTTNDATLQEILAYSKNIKRELDRPTRIKTKSLLDKARRVITQAT